MLGGEPRESLAAILCDGTRAVPRVLPVRHPEPRKAPQRNAGARDPQRPIPVKVPVERGVKEAQLAVQADGVGEAGGEQGVVAAQARCGGREVKWGASPFDGYHRVAGVGLNQPTAAADEALAEPKLCDDRVKVVRVLKPIIVVKPHNHLAARLSDGGVASIHLPAPRIPAGVDARLTEGECGRGTAAVAIVDHNRFPILMRLPLQRLQGVADRVRALVGRHNDTDAHAWRVAAGRQVDVTMNRLRYASGMLPSPLLPRVLFIGDVIGEPGISFLEGTLPSLRAEHRVDLVVVNGENAHAVGNPPLGAAGLGPRDAERLFTAGADVITGGNHSWDHASARAGLELPGVLRPLNMGARAPGRGACVLERGGIRYGVVNIASRSAIPAVDHPYDALDACLSGWRDEADAVVVDFHGDSVSEKITFAYAFDGRVAAVVGTHTHIRTADERVLPGGTAYVTDVGMTGPQASMQGYEPEVFVEAYRRRVRDGASRVAKGAVTLSAVMIYLAPPTAVAIRRIDSLS